MSLYQVEGLAALAAARCARCDRAPVALRCACARWRWAQVGRSWQAAAADAPERAGAPRRSWRGLPRRDPPARVAARPLGHPARAPSAAERRSGAKKGMRLAGVAPPSLCARCAGLSPASCATPPLGRAPPCGDGARSGLRARPAPAKKGAAARCGAPWARLVPLSRLVLASAGRRRARGLQPWWSCPPWRAPAAALSAPLRGAPPGGRVRLSVARVSG